MKVSTLHVQALLEGLRLCGHHAPTFAARAGISPAIAEGAIGWIDASEFEQMCVLALDFTSDEAFGLHWGSTEFAQFDLGRAAAYSESLAAAIERLDEFARRLAWRPEVALEVSHERASFVVHALATSKRGRRVRDEFVAAALMRLFEHFGVRGAIAVEFAHAAPPHAAEYRRVLRVPLRFGCPRTSIVMPREVLATSNLAPNRIMMGGLRQMVEALLPVPESEPRVVDRLRLLFAGAWPTLPRIGEAARLLQVSERTLRRVLEREGQAYSKLVQEAQIARAEQLLASSPLSVKEIAAEVGFQSATAFQRAFKRQTGMTPVGFRAARSS